MCIRDRKGCAKKPVAQGVTANPGPATGATPTHDVAVPLKSTLAESGTGKLPSVTSIAVYVTTSLTPSVAVNAICPLTSVTLGFGAVMIEWPAPCDDAISLPGVGRLSASFSVTVIVDVLVWSGGTLVGDAAMPAPAAGGTRNSMPGWSASTTLSVVSVAVKTSVSCVRSVTVNTTAPLLPSDGPLAGVITALPPASGTSDGNTGAVVFTVTDLTQETLVLTATDTTDNVVLADQPVIEFLVPPAASAGIAASPTSVPPDQTSTSTITVTLKDALNRPTPGKEIALSQGAGHSIVSAPNPSITDANGQIAFTATDGISEVVTYTAIDVTDSGLPVPGSATVDFTGAATSCVGPPPVGGPGFAVTPWATGFFAHNFNFAGVNWLGCPGAQNPTFSPSGDSF